MNHGVGVGENHHQHIQKHYAANHNGPDNADRAGKDHNDNQHRHHCLNGIFTQDCADKQAHAVDFDAFRAHHAQAEYSLSQRLAVAKKHGNNKFHQQKSQENANRCNVSIAINALSEPAFNKPTNTPPRKFLSDK